MKTEYKEYSREEKIEYFIKKIAYFELKLEKAKNRLNELRNDTALAKAKAKKSARSK